MTWLILHADARHIPLAAQSVHCVVTSPPYWGLRDYGVAGQLGLEDTPQQYIENMLIVFAEVWRVLRPDGTLWLNIGDSYAANRGYQVVDNKHVDVGNNHASRVPFGLKPKDLCGIPWRLAFALQDHGWYLRADIIWAKNNPMPESITDRPTKAHEYLFLLTKNERYYYDQEAIKEASIARESYQGRKPRYTVAASDNITNTQDYRTRIGILNATGKKYPSRNARSVWTIPTEPTPFAHFATFPTVLVERCIKAGCPKGGIVFDPFSGSGTTVLVSDRLSRHGIGLDLNPSYCSIASNRLFNDAPLFAFQ